MKKALSITLGVLLILCGVLYVLEVFGIGNINFSLNGWWTLFIIIPCINGIFTSKDKIGSAIGLLIGVLLLLAAQEIVSYDIIWKLTAPAIIVAIGVKIIIKALRAPKNNSNV